MIMGHAHPGFWEFICKICYTNISFHSYCVLFESLIHLKFILDNIQTVGDIAVRDLNSVSAGRLVRLPRRRNYLRQDSQISAAIRNLNSGAMTTLEFLIVVSNFFEPLQDNIAIHPNENVKMFVYQFRQILIDYIILGKRRS